MGKYTANFKKPRTEKCTEIYHQLFRSLHVPLVVLTALYIAWWGVVGHNICCVPTHCTSNTNVCGLCPHQLSKVASIAAETGIAKAVVLYLIVPHVRSLLRCELRPRLVRQVLTHPCNRMRCKHELAIYATGRTYLRGCRAGDDQCSLDGRPRSALPLQPPWTNSMVANRASHGTCYAPAIAPSRSHQPLRIRLQQNK